MIKKPDTRHAVETAIEKPKDLKAKYEQASKYTPPRYDDIFFKGLEWLDRCSKDPNEWGWDND